MEATQQIESGSNAPSPMAGATMSGLQSAKGNRQDFPPFQLTHKDLSLYALGGMVTVYLVHIGNILAFNTLCSPSPLHPSPP